MICGRVYDKLAIRDHTAKRTTTRSIMSIDVLMVVVMFLLHFDGGISFCHHQSKTPPTSAYQQYTTTRCSGTKERTAFSFSSSFHPQSSSSFHPQSSSSSSSSKWFVRADSSVSVLRTSSEIYKAILFMAISFVVPFIIGSDHRAAAWAAETAAPALTLSTNDVEDQERQGLIDLTKSEAKVTDICWMDLQIGDSSESQRIEISLYGDIVPRTVENFKSLCRNENNRGYKGSEFFRIISEFSVQGGNIGMEEDAPTSRRGRFGKAANGEPFLPENFRILHNTKGVVSMMKDNLNKGTQDSRFFITLNEDASWADGKYSAFGRVTKGNNFIDALTIIPVTPPANYPQTTVKIVDSGMY